MFFNRKKKMTINEGYELFLKDASSLLVDVREKDEFAMNHLPKAINLPLSMLQAAPQLLRDKNQKLFVYCRSGARSEKAMIDLKKMGYTDVTNIGGILDFTGQYE